MKLDICLYAVTYSSYNKNENDLYMETIGVYPTQDAAYAAMIEDRLICADSDDELDEWKLSSDKKRTWYENDGIIKKYKITQL